MSTLKNSSANVRCIRATEIENNQVIVISERTQDFDENSIQSTEDAVVLNVENLVTHFALKRSILATLTGQSPESIRAVDDISLQLNTGSTLGLVGESGSGKSTLARSILALIEPTQGEIKLGEKELPPALKNRNRDVFSELQLVFQNPQESLNPYRTIGDTLTRSVRRLAGVNSRAAQGEAKRLLEFVQLDASYLTRLPNQLSGGEKQRVAIARAFASSPSLIICDEPTSALDVSVQARILNLLNELQSTNQNAYLFISHDLAVVGYISDAIAVIYAGQLMEFSEREAFFEPPFHPYTEALLSAIPSTDPTRKAIRLEGELPSPTEEIRGCPFASRCPHVIPDLCESEKPPWHETPGGKQIYCHINPEDLTAMQSSYSFNQIKKADS